MKTVIGFVCGVIGIILTVAAFVVGLVAGFGLGIKDELREEED